MTFGKLLKASTQSIFRNKMRSFLTSLGIIIGVGSVIVMVAVGSGSQDQIKKQIQSMGTNLIMVMPPRGPREANRLTMDDVAKLRNESSYLAAISGVVRMSSAKVVGGSGDWSTSVYGIEPGYFEIKSWTLGSGDFFTDKDLSRRAKVAVIGSTVAEELFPGEDPVGKSIRISTTPFTIVGVLGSKGAGNNGTDQDDIVMVPLDTAVNRLMRDGNVQSIEMSIIREDLMDEAQAEITAILMEAHRLTADDEMDFTVMNQSEIIATASQTSETLTSLLAAIAGVSLIVGGIGIMNIMLVSVTERTREIGIRMSVGARKRDILLQFLSESVILSLLGGFLGIVLALALAWALEAFMGMPTIVSPSVIAASAGFAAAVGIFFGFYPAKKAANLYPIDALRYE